MGIAVGQRPAVDDHMPVIGPGELSGLWLAYVGDEAWGLGGLARFVLALILGASISLDRLRRRKRRHRDRLDELLSKL